MSAKRRGLSNPSAKGASFERAVCARLSLWVSGLTRDDVFWRSAMSGGRANLPSRRARGQTFTAQAGDISAIHADGHLLLEHFVIECKHHCDFEIHALVYSNRGRVASIWAKTCEEARREKREPFLVFKQNNQHEMFGLSAAGISFLSAGSARPIPTTAGFPALDLYVGLFRDLLTEVDFALLRDPAPKRARLKRG